MPRPAGLAFSLDTLHSSDQGSMEIQPICAAKCLPMSRIEDHLWIGSWRDLEDPCALRDAGVTHILNVAKEVDPTAHEECLGCFESLHIPLADEHRENIIEHLEDACAFIEAAKTAGGQCLVHCRRGISRSPAIVVGYLMRQQGRSYDAAVTFVKEQRACTSLNIAFREFLMSYDTPHVIASQNGAVGGGAPRGFGDEDSDDAAAPSSTAGGRGPSSSSRGFGDAAPAESAFGGAKSDDDADRDEAHPTPGTSEGGQMDGAARTSSAAILFERETQSPPTD